MFREEKKVVIKAIADLGHRVTAADVASKTGLSLSDTSSMLNAIAAEAGGHLEVSEAGDIAYRFKNNFQSAYLATGIRAVFATVFDKIFAIIFYLLKISFGIFLCISLIIVVIAFIIIAVLSSQFGDRKDFNLKELLEFFNFLIIRDLIFWGKTSEQTRPENQIEGQAVTDKTRSGKGNFFVNSFSFLFGAGDPNTHIEEEKWRLAAQAIRENGGVVIKEQLAPYIGPELDDADSILPVLTRFEGRPAVTTKGNIAYIFPSLQVTTDADFHPDGEDAAAAAARQGYLKEERWKFSHLSAEALKPVYVIAGLNLFGTLWLYYIFNCMFRFRWEWTEIMVAYGALFVVIPLFRQAWQTMLNRRIKMRNLERQEAAKIVSQPDQEIIAKLAERQEFATAMHIRAVQADHLAFTTERETLEQQFPDDKLDPGCSMNTDGSMNKD
jgi:hypothetical protein